MLKLLPLRLRSAAYALKGGFLIRPLAIALVLGCAGVMLSSLEETQPIVAAWGPGSLSAGLDSLLQAAGRCNREFRLAAGRLVVFEPVENRAPHDLRQAWDAGRAVLRRHDDPQTLDAIADYFRELYFNKGIEAFDACKLDRDGEAEIWPILRNIADRADTMLFPFASIARAFRVIEETMVPVVVPWSSGPGDTEAEMLLGRIRSMETPSRADLRRLQQYIVSVPKRDRDRWLALGALAPVHPRLGQAMLCFADTALYDERSGLRVGGPEHRSAVDNIFEKPR